MATRLGGASDVFGNRRSSNNINFIAAHDGFTLRDLIDYQAKQNMANGEDSRDGNSSEVTCVGTDVRAPLATLFVSRAAIMITAGDEYGRKQGRNNNAYAQDNETIWLGWQNRYIDLINFVTSLGAFRYDLLQWFEDSFMTPTNAVWLDAMGAAFDWSNAKQDFVCLILRKDSWCATLSGKLSSCLHK